LPKLWSAYFVDVFFATSSYMKVKFWLRAPDAFFHLKESPYSKHSIA
jgi:hypothetical protein